MNSANRGERPDFHSLRTSTGARVVHVPHNIAGNPAGVSRAEANLGVRSSCWTLQPHIFGYGSDRTYAPASASGLQVEMARWRMLRDLVLTADIVHFNFGSPVLRSKRDAATGKHGWLGNLCHFKDLKLLRALGKRLFVTFQGDDLRTGKLARSLPGFNTTMGVTSDYYTPESDAAKVVMLADFAEHCEEIFFVNPDLGRMMPSGRGQFLPYCHIDLQDWVPCPEQKARPLIVHAPSHRGFKGTQFVLAAVEQLRARGLDFDFRLIENMPFTEAIRLYREADILVDQLLAGWYGGLAVELMALGKPVVAYLRTEDFAYLPAGMADQLPIVNATPDTVGQVLLQLIEQGPVGRRRLGERSRAFVEAWHNPSKVAGQTLMAYGLAGIPDDLHAH